MKVQSSVVIIDRTELKKEGLRLAVLYNAQVNKLNEFADYRELDKDRLDEYLAALKEKCLLEGVITFIRTLLDEEEVNPEDYGIPCVHIG